MGNTGLEHSIDEKRRDGIESQISQFLDNELPGLVIPYSQQPEPPLQSFMVQKKIDFLLWGFRSEITSLQYDDSKANNFSFLALQTIKKMQSFSQESRQSFSLRHQMVSSLAGALLAICSLVVREALSPDPNAQAGSEHHRQGFQATLDLLRGLAEGLPYARRVLQDFDPLLHLINGVIGHSAIIPAHVFSLFPYRTPTIPTQHTPLPQGSSAAGTFLPEQSDSAHLADVGCAVLWL